MSLILFGCGADDAESGESPESVPAGPGESTAAGPSTPPGRSPGSGSETSIAQRVFAPQIPRRRPDFDQIAAGVDPAHPSDPWPGELLAGSAETVVERLATHLAHGRPQAELRSLVTRDLTGQVPAVSADGRSQGPVTLTGDALLARLASDIRIAGHPPGDVVVEVEVTAVDAPALGARPEDLPGGGPLTGRTTVHVRAGTRPEAAGRTLRVQADAVWDVAWRLGRRARISSIDLVSSQRSELRPPFRDVTDAILRGLDLDEVLGLGALEAGGRTDRLAAVSDIQIAMHGAAVGDVDGDGWEDLVVGRAAGQPNLLFMNEGGVLREDGAARGLDLLEDTGGMLIVDLDGDGARDVVMGIGPDVVVAWNDGAGRFGAPQALPHADGDRVYSICAADVDGDGDLDLYDTRYFKSGGYGAQAPTPYHDATNGAPNVFWRNRLVDGDAAQPRAFRDDTAAVGLDVDNDRFSLVGAFDDLDGDGDLDLYVANDFGRNNLYLWDGARFRAAPADAGLVDKAAGMGISIADADLDGQVDVVVSNMFSAAGMRVTRDARFQPSFGADARADFMRHARGNSLFRGVAPGVFEDITEAAGAAPGGWAWGSRFVDWDRDGLVDIVVPNGFLSGRKGPDLQSFFWRRVVGASPLVRDAGAPELDRYLGAWSVISHLSQFERQDWNARERTYGYANRGGFQFDDVTLSSGLGFADDGRALVTCDLDQDGRLDLVFRNRTSPILRVLQGTVEGGHWVALRLEDEGPNRDAIGALLTVTAGGVPRRARVTAGDGFLGGSTLEAFFGIAAPGPEGATALDSIRVRWPDGTQETFATRSSDGSAVLDGAWTLRRGAGVPQLRHRGGAPRPALDAALPASRPSAAPGAPRVRVPLFAEFPLGAWRLPSFDGAAERIDEIVGDRGLLVVLWAGAAAPSVDALGDLARRAPQFASLGVRVHPLSLDGVRDADAAETAARASGLAELGGRADRATRTIVELVLGRTLAPFDDLPLPLGLLFDGEGDLSCLYVGELDTDIVLADAGALAARAAVDSTAPLTGGRWAGPAPPRSLSDLPDKLATRGFDELAEHLRSRSGKR